MPNRAHSWLGSMFGLRCPRCRTGRLFPTATFSFSEPFEMPRTCPKCNLDYWPEPGFYYGAMFLSYIGICWPCLGFVLLLHWVFGLSLAASMAWLTLIAALSFVYIFRAARSLWIHINVTYDQEISDRVNRPETQ